MDTRRRAVTVSLLVFTLITFTETVLACSCGPNPGSESEALRASFHSADAVFVGTVKRTDIVGSRYEQRRIATVSVKTRFKGVESDSVTVTTAVSGATCGIPLDVGTEYLFFARKRGPAEYSTGLCTHTAPSHYYSGDMETIARLAAEPQTEKATPQPTMIHPAPVPAAR